MIHSLAQFKKYIGSVPPDEIREIVSRIESGDHAASELFPFNPILKQLKVNRIGEKTFLTHHPSVPGRDRVYP